MGYNGATRTFDTLSDLRQQRGTANARANLLGYSTVGDGGEGEFYWDNSSVAAEDGGTIFLPSVGSGAGRWRRNHVGCVYPRWWGAKGDDETNDTTAFQSAMNFAAPRGLIVDGEAKSYKVAALNWVVGALNIQNVTFNLTAGTYGLKAGEIDEPPVVYKRNLTLKDVTFKGSCTYALIVSTITGIYLRELQFQGVSATNDVFYLLNTYDGIIDGMEFVGCSAGVGGACLNMPAGVNGVDIGRIYTSAFTDFGIKISSGAAMNIMSPVIQGALTGIFMTSCNGICITNPYFENTVNPIEINTSVSDVGSISFIGGFWAGPYSSHPKIAQNNGVYVRYIGGTNNVTINGGSFDLTVGSSKKLASVGSSAIINVLRPKLSTGGSTPEVTDYLFKEIGALSTAGFYVEYTRTANAYTTVRRTSDIANEHVVEYFDAGANLLRATWSPPNVGSAAVALSFYNNRVRAAATASYSITTGDDVIRFNATSALIATLPNTSVPTGKIFIIKKTAGTFGISVVVNGGIATIDGSASYSITGTGDSVHFQWDGTNYIVICKSIASVTGITFAENTTLTDSLTLTNAALNTAYPIGAYPIGSKAAYTNLSDEGMSQNVAECTRVSATNWYINLTPYKAS
jgi:hypothetical protein